MFELSALDPILHLEPHDTALTELRESHWRLCIGLLEERLDVEIRAVSGPPMTVPEVGTAEWQAFVRTLLAPQTQVRLLRPANAADDPVGPYIRSAMAVEACRSGGDQSRSPRCTAYGELEADAPEQDDLGVWRGPCLRLASGPLLDFGGCYWRERSGVLGEHYAPDQRRPVAAHFARAMTMLPDVSREAAALVSHFVRAIALYHSPSSDQYCSGSLRFRFGDIEFLNAHRMDLGTTMASLLHESVHVLIETAELFEPFYVPVRLRLKKTVRSPWTGREISATALAHACFVWYALYWFWQRAATSTLDLAVVEHNRTLAARGFFSSSLCEALRDIVEPTVLELVDACQTRIRSDAASEVGRPLSV
jgi:hypothetical protein